MCRLLIICLLLFMIHGCQPNSGSIGVVSEISQTSKVINVINNAMSCDKGNYENWVSSIRFLSLESCEECFFDPRVDKIEIEKNLIAILNRKYTPGLRLFDLSTGKFIGALSNEKSAPKSSFWESTIDFEFMNDKIVTINYLSSKAYYYNLDGDILGSTSIPNSYEGIEKDNNNRLAYLSYNENDCTQIINWNSILNKLDTFILRENLDYCSYFRVNSEHTFFSGVNGELFFYPNYGNILFYFQDNSWQKLIIRPEEGDYPKSYYVSLRSNDPRDNWNFIQESNNNFDYFMPFNYFVALKDFYFFHNFMNQQHYLTFVDLRSLRHKTFILDNRGTNSLFEPNFIQFGMANTAIQILDSDLVAEFAESYKDKKFKLTKDFIRLSGMDTVLNNANKFNNNYLVFMNFDVDKIF